MIIKVEASLIPTLSQITEKRFVLPSTRGKVLPMSTTGIHARVIVSSMSLGIISVSEDMPLEDAEELALTIERANTFEVRVTLEAANDNS